MEESGGQHQELKFALMITKTLSDGQERYSFQSANDGIPDADVAFSVQAWVEKLTEKIKEQRISGTTFGR